MSEGIKIKEAQVRENGKPVKIHAVYYSGEKIGTIEKLYYPIEYGGNKKCFLNNDKEEVFEKDTLNECVVELKYNIKPYRDKIRVFHNNYPVHLLFNNLGA